jgi:hypothetical protein
MTIERNSSPNVRVDHQRTFLLLQTPNCLRLSTINTGSPDSRRDYNDSRCHADALAPLSDSLCSDILCLPPL